MRKISFILTFIYFFLLPFGSIFAETIPDSTTGFVSGNIWYSQAKLTERDDVKIYTGFWNGETNPVTIKVDFFDKDTILGSREVTVPALSLRDVSIPWNVTSGDHQIRAVILKATSSINGTNKEIILVKNEVETSAIFIPKKIDANVGVAQLEKIGEKVVDVLPKSVAVPITDSVKSVDLFREKTASTLETKVAETKKEIKEIEADVVAEKTDTKSTEILNLDEIKGEAEEGSKIEEEKKTDSKVIKPTTIKKATTQKTNTTNTKSKDSLSGTERPIAYVQLFLLNAALFIFAHSWLFYSLIIIITFLSIRFLYRKIRGK